tara:strand:+ start:515 stop:1318 length:804 start_codon:yes stop_codon:yes gene_type:complete
MILNSKYNFLKPYKVNKLKRYGRKFDGGYLVCEDAIKNINNCITLGVGDDISFEIDLEKNKKLSKVYLFDYTVNHFLFIRIILKYLRRFITLRSSLQPLLFSIKNYIQFINFLNKENVFFHKKKVVNKIRSKLDINLEKIFSEINNKNNLLKIDIEGGEYLIIKDILKNSKKLSIIVIEFHWIKKNKKKFENSVKKLQTKFDIVHIHVNNYKPIDVKDEFFDVVELTLVNKINNKFKSKFRYNFPIKNLDFDCFPNHKTIKFSFAKK